MDVADALARLETINCHSRPSGRGWLSHCPAHDDREKSLSIGEGENGKPLLHCFAGCTYESIRAALEAVPKVAGAVPKVSRARREPEPFSISDEDVLSWRRNLGADTFVLWQLRLRLGWTREALRRLEVGLSKDLTHNVVVGTPVRVRKVFPTFVNGERLTSPIRDAESRLVGVVRYDPPFPGHKRVKAMAVRGSRRELFPAPETIEELEIMLVEGEADCVSAWSTGMVAVAIPGTSYAWSAERAQRFAGRRVTIPFDCDSPGRTAAEKARKALEPYAESVRVLDLDPARDDGFDLRDWLACERLRQRRPGERGYADWVRHLFELGYVDLDEMRPAIAKHREIALKDRGSLEDYGIESAVRGFMEEGREDD
jgi:Toprim-like